MSRQRSYPRKVYEGKSWLLLLTDTIHSDATVGGKRLVSFPDFDQIKRSFAKLIELYWTFRWEIPIRIFGDDWCIPDETRMVLRYLGLAKRAVREAHAMANGMRKHYNQEGGK